MSFLTRLLDRWRAHRNRRSEAALNWLKARYHIFRVLLANNERALEALAEADRLLRENEPSRLPATVQELRETVLELVDGLNRLTGNAHAGLYPRLAQIERALDAALEGYARAPRRKWLELSEVRPDMREQAGGKAQPLGGLIRAGLPVPEGLCLTRRFCREYLRRAKLEGRLAAILREAAQTKPDADAGPDLNALAARARGMIAASAPDAELAAELKAAWAHLAAGGAVSVSVRSSASSEDGGEHSFAGQYKSVLGVRGEQAFVEAFKTVLASAFSARALAYRALVGRGGGGGEALDMAVLCQRMVDARTSGVLFSVDPTSPLGQANALDPAANPASNPAANALANMQATPDQPGQASPSKRQDSSGQASPSAAKELANRPSSPQQSGRSAQTELSGQSGQSSQSGQSGQSGQPGQQAVRAVPGGRMLLTAVPGLGTQAVSGRAPADVFRPARDPGAEGIEATPAELAEKTVREVETPQGGLELEELAGPERFAPLLSPPEIEALRDHALRIEALAGRPQDIEWSIDHAGRIWILQARPALLARQVVPAAASAGGTVSGEIVPGQVISGQALPGQTMPGQGGPLLTGGVGASPGKAAGRVAVVRTRADLDAAAKAPKPVVLVLHQSLVDAASLAPEAAAIVVDMGNPLDHLAGLARELGIPMLTGLGTATAKLAPGDWVLVDADQGLVRAVDPRLWRNAPRPAPRRAGEQDAAARAVRELVLALYLTDAYGPTFSILEAKSLHDLVRYTHEKAVMALFEAGDAIAEETFSLVHRLKDPAGLIFLIIDLGGGLAPNRPTEIAPADILSEPLAALCRGMGAEGLRWGAPPPIAGLSGLMARGMLDGRSERPVGNPNYALVARDYLNLNARVDYHFVLVDCVCGANPRENAIRFRFKGGGTARAQRERRAGFVEEVLKREEFFTNRQGDMVTAVLSEGSRQTMADKLDMLGRLIGFSRLLDAVMVTDDMPRRVAEAFLAGDYALDGLTVDVSGGE